MAFRIEETSKFSEHVRDALSSSAAEALDVIDDMIEEVNEWATPEDFLWVAERIPLPQVTVEEVYDLMVEDPAEGILDPQDPSHDSWSEGSWMDLDDEAEGAPPSPTEPRESCHTCRFCELEGFFAPQVLVSGLLNVDIAKLPINEFLLALHGTKAQMVLYSDHLAAGISAFERRDARRSREHRRNRRETFRLWDDYQTAAGQKKPSPLRSSVSPSEVLKDEESQTAGWEVNEGYIMDMDMSGVEW